MRPIRLSFAGLRSYRGEAVIDFADLDLFAIVGDTGAGKSTIIEALSLALYGKKTWKSGGSAKTDLIADGQAVMRVELRFEADGHPWTVTRSWRRSGSPGVNRLERADRTEKVDGASEVNKRVVELLGLDHAQFTQAVVMPQGRFDELLQASATDRSRLLASILGLDAVRRAGADAAALRQRWLEPVALATDRRGRLPVDPAAELGVAERAEAELAARATTLGAAVAEVEAHDARAGSIGRSLEAVQRALAALPTLATDPVAALEAAHRLGADLVERHQQLSAEATTLDVAVERLGDTAAKLLDGFDGRDDAVAARARLGGSAEALRAALVDLAAADADLAELEASAPVVSVDPALDAAVDAAEVRLADATAARARAVAADDAVRRGWAALVDARATLAERVGAVAAADDVMAHAGRVAAGAAEARDRAIELAEQAIAELAAATRADAVAAIASGCERGDDCPVCRQPLPSDFAPPPGADLDAASARAREAGTALDVARERAAGAERDRAHASDAAARAAQERDAARDAEQQRAAELRDAGGDPDAPNLDGAATVVGAALAAADHAVAEATDALRSSQDARSAAAHALDVARVAHEAKVAAAARDRSAAERRVAEHTAVGAALPPAWRPGAPASVDAVLESVSAIDAMLVELDALEAERRSTLDARTQLDAQLAEVASRAEHEVTGAAREALGTINARLARIADLADAVAAAAPAATVDVSGSAAATGDDGGADAGEGVGAGEGAGVGDRGGPTAAAPTLFDVTPTTVDDDDVIVAPALLPATAKARELGALVVAAGEALGRAAAIEARGQQTAVRLAEEQAAASAALAAALRDTGCASVGDLRSEHGRTTERLAQATRTVATARADREAAAGLDAFLAAAGPFVANLTVLVEALRDREFVDHLVTAREAELIAEADRRLRAITGSRFGFVRDFGVVSVASGEVRTPDALSGGERFQAALALALSLVEIASRGRGRLEAVFVDEGFGSLDSRSLDSALATLGEVAGGGKMVGLISHLKPVAEAVETVLLVTKDDVRGSVIERLDADAREQMLDDDIRSGLTA